MGGASGRILREEFGANEHLCLQVGYRLHVSPPTVNDIVREKRGITPEMATRLAKYFGTSEQFWLTLQDAFRSRSSGSIPRTSRPSSLLPQLQPDSSGRLVSPDAPQQRPPSECAWESWLARHHVPCLLW